MLSRETSDWSLKRRSDSLDDEEFGDFEEDKDLDEDFDDELDEDELDEEDLDELDEYDDLDDEFDDDEDEEFRPKKGPRRDWEEVSRSRDVREYEACAPARRASGSRPVPPSRLACQPAQQRGHRLRRLGAELVPDERFVGASMTD